MLNKLEQTIQDILTNAVTSWAREIAQAVRADLAAEIIGSTTGLSIGAVGTPKRRGRPPGSGKAKVGVAAQGASVAAAPVVKGGKGQGKVARKKSGKRRSITQAELGTVLGVLAKKPGLTSVQIQKEAGLDPKEAARLLGKLRETKKVKWQGERSGAKYTVA